MKQTIFNSIAIFAVLSTASAQTKAPAAVATAFNAKFAEAKNIKWEKENAHEYEAAFQLNGIKCAANFTEKGEWLETESPITFAELPDAVQKAFTVAHKKAKIKVVEKIEMATGVTHYEVEMKGGKEVLYNADGTLVKK
ncbi:MAG: hypothetical protein RI894_292 [Bacteroidota bacterium]|jgi:hypothetical protein